MGEYPGVTSVDKHLSSQAKRELSPSSCPWAFLKQTCFYSLISQSPFLLHLHSMDINTAHRPRDLVPQLDIPQTPLPESGSHFRLQAVLASGPEGTAN